MPQSLQLRFCSRPQRDAAAWFIPGGDPNGWLDEIALWGSTGDRLVLHVVAHASDDDSPPLGVLVSGSSQPLESRRAMPWGCVAGRLFLPVEAAFEPPVTEQELAHLLPGDDDTCAWHPQAGLIRFESDETLTVADLLTVGTARDVRWDLAEPGIAFAERLVSVTAETLPQADDVLGSSRDDIGSEGGQLDDLPPAPGESSPGPVDRAARAVKEFVANAARRVAAAVSGGAASAGTGAGTWMDRIDQWATGVLNQLRLEGERMRELRRLLSTLDSDPDQGLRKALPFSDLGTDRGVTPPGNRLLPRDVDWSLGRLTAGGPADHWKVPYEIQVQLLTKYRELASRELRLGRYRRAAYIFGELIGDLHAAAQALEQGGFYLEAAALYQDRLRLPLSAAQCLERGGLLHQAAELYVKLGVSEEAARLFDQLGRPDTAREHWDLAARKRLSEKDFLRAAELTREKLGDTERALEILDSAWQTGHGSGPECLTEWFRLTGDLGRHSAADERLKELQSQLNRVELILPILAEAHQSYPDATIRHLSADASRVLVAGQLPVASATEQESLVRMLSRFDRHDRLLKRDCNRFVSNLVRPTPSSQKFVSQLGHGGIQPIFNVSRTPGLVWEVASSTSRGLYLAGYDIESGSFNLELIPWPTDGPPQPRWRLSWDVPCDEDERPLLLPDPAESLPVIVHLRRSRALSRRIQQFPHPGLEACTLPRFHANQTLAAACDRGGLIWHLATNGSEIWLETIARRSKNVTNTHDLTVDLSPSLEDFLSVPTEVGGGGGGDWHYDCVAEHGYCFIARGASIFVSHPQWSSVRMIRFDSPIVDMAVSRIHTRKRVVVSTVEGVYVIYGDFWNTEPTRLTVDLSSAKLTLTKGGYVAAVDARRCVMLHISSGRMRELDWPATTAPMAVVTTPHPNAFAAVSTDGTIRGFKLE